MNHRPAISATPHIIMAADGTVPPPSILLVRSTSNTAVNGPMAFAISFEPWEKANADAVNTCIQENTVNVARDSSCRRSVRANTNTAIHTMTAIMPSIKPLPRPDISKWRFLSPLKIIIAPMMTAPPAAKRGTPVSNARCVLSESRR